MRDGIFFVQGKVSDALYRVGEGILGRRKQVPKFLRVLIYCMHYNAHDTSARPRARTKGPSMRWWWYWDVICNTVERPYPAKPRSSRAWECWLAKIGGSSAGGTFVSSSRAVAGAKATQGTAVWKTSLLLKLPSMRSRGIGAWGRVFFFTLFSKFSCPWHRTRPTRESSAPRSVLIISLEVLFLIRVDWAVRSCSESQGMLFRRHWADVSFFWADLRKVGPSRPWSYRMRRPGYETFSECHSRRPPEV